MNDLAKFVFDTAVAATRVRALELGLPDPLPSAPKPGGALSLFGRPDLFASVQVIGAGQVPRIYRLHADLTSAQRIEAHETICAQYAPILYGCRLVDNEIKVG